MFILAASNGVWLVSLLLPIAYASMGLHVVIITAALYAYLAVVFFALYRGRTLARTIGRFAVFAAADLILTLVLSAALFGLVYRSVLLI